MATKKTTDDPAAGASDQADQAVAADQAAAAEAPTTGPPVEGNDSAPAVSDGQVAQDAGIPDTKTVAAPPAEDVAPDNGGPEDYPEATPEGDAPQGDVVVLGHEHDPTEGRRLDALDAWLRENPDATVVPPSLLPPDFRDAGVATPGLPPELTTGA